MLKKILENRSTRILVLLFSVLTLLVILAIVNSYFVQINLHKQSVLSRLEAISLSAASQIDGDELSILIQQYEEKDQLKSNQEVEAYAEINKLLKRIKEEHQIRSDIYTLTYDEDSKKFFFGVSSSDKPYYRHTYSNFPKELLAQYETGGKVGVYEDEHGHWLSAFTPIYNSNNEVIAVVQVDSQFDEFIDEARSSIFLNLIITVIVMLIFIFFLLRSVRSILREEDALKSDLIYAKDCLEQQNHDIIDSINYAQKIQNAILNRPETFTKLFPDSFIFFKPKDIVSGDFYWFKQVGEFKLVASVDCTGHGVPGAFMSMIGSTSLDEIVMSQQLTSPNLILDQLQEKIVKALNQKESDSNSKDGMDVAMCVIHEKYNKLYYTGACRPLVYVRNGEVYQIKADPIPIGGVEYIRSGYTIHELDIEKGDAFYIFSDGYPDQFGGPKDKKYMTQRFRKFLLSISSESFEMQYELLENEFVNWKGANEQVDDILVIGFQYS
tara:strand:- start:642 stop:2129 length:1488 start_codon:yes stop_codon:yes gene_type:complete